MPPQFASIDLLPLQLALATVWSTPMASGRSSLGRGAWPPGTRVYVFVQRSGAPGTKREPAWAAHEKITVSDRRR